MAVKHIEIRTCDRCTGEIDRRTPIRLEIGWFKLIHGSGSKLSTAPNRRDNLDKDLCGECTRQFFAWWEEDYPNA